jgi:xanthine/uracil permease
VKTLIASVAFLIFSMLLGLAMMWVGLELAPWLKGPLYAWMGLQLVQSTAKKIFGGPQ